MRIIQKILAIIAGAIGTIELVMPIIKEALVDVARICGLVFFWTDYDEQFIDKLNEWYNIAEDWVETIKDKLLGLPV